LTINYSDTAYFSATACDSYVWHDETYTTSGTYEYLTQTVNGCDSLEILTLTINNTVYTEETITACDSYTWNGETYAESGEYTYTTTAANGCDSIVTLHLTINNTQYAEETVTACDSYTWNGETYTASGEYTYTTTATNGCDSIVTLHLTINNTQYAEETVTACDAYTWNGETYTTSGDYVYTTVAANGCDSIVTLHLTINNSEIGETEYVTICYGETYTWNGQTYSAEGEYSITLTNALGCDSVATLQLTIMPESVTTTETVVIGNDELPYTWRGNTYSTTGRYTDVEQYATVACDSAIYVLDLTVLTTGNFDEQSVTICETEAPYLWYGESYTATGKYTYTEKYVGTDIDSIQHILNLTVNPTVYTEEHITACDSYTWNGETYTASGDYVYTTVAANGCDSIVTLHLTINPTQYAEESVVACDSYTWNGETYTASGDYVYTTTAANGCDSIVTLHLTINNSEIGETEYITICYGETYTWNSQTYSASGTYNITLQNTNGCDSVVTLQLTVLPEAVTEIETITIENNDLPYTWRGQSYTATGQYTDIVKYVTTDCDSAIYVLDLTILTTGAIEETDTIICESTLPYLWYDQTLTTNGKYTHIEKYAGTDIDSIQYILNLIVSPTTYGSEEITILLGDTYHWNGNDYNISGEYIDTLLNIYGCDSVVTLKLTVLDNQVNIRDIQIEEQCADANTVEIIIDVEGTVDSVGLSFDFNNPNIIASGLYDTIVPMPMDGYLSIPYANIRAGKYEAILAGYFYQRVVFSENISLTFLYPSSVLEQRWNDVVAVLAKDYNGGYEFVAFQWYKDGQILAGETRSYFSEPFEMGSEYSALLTEADGTQLMTCPIIIEKHTDITLYPTIVATAQQIHCNVSLEGQLYLYDSTGKLYMHHSLNQGDNYISAPNVAGIYMAKIILLTGEEKDVKILVF
jgi:hypothetical protein